MDRGSMQALLQRLIQQMSRVVLDKDHTLRLALACVLAEGHLLLEDVPGMGKTTLAQALAKVLGLQFERFQFTSDVLPADILGAAVFDKHSGHFSFRQGPVFTQVLLADELNRASPKTQSALLEAMEEGQVTIEGETRPLPSPFFVIATQNPLAQSGTFPLPESQLDRFLMRLSLGYPSPAAERALLAGMDARAELRGLTAAVTAEQWALLQQQVKAVKVSDAVLDYVQRLVAFTRKDPAVRCGLSPRGALGWIRAAKAWALIQQRAYVTPDDIQAVMAAVLEHRLEASGQQPLHQWLQQMLQKVPVVA